MRFYEKGHKKAILLFFYAVIIIICSYLFFKYLLPCLLPFAIGFAAAYCTRKPVLFLRRKFKFRHSFSSFVVLVGIASVLCGGIYFFVSKALGELATLTEYITEDRISSVFSSVTESVAAFSEKHFPKTSAKLTANIITFSETLKSSILSLIESFVPKIGKFVVDAVKFFPDAMLFSGIVLLSAFYFSCDYEKITSFIKNQLNARQNARLSVIKNEFIITAVGILRAYAILVMMTFFELWAGLAIIGIKYSALLAIIIALIDILPVLGTGTILIPWSILLFLSGNSKNGLCILIIYVIITIVRQIAEPKILGSSSGLHPLAMLISMYFGIKLMGIFGLFVFPLGVITVCGLNEKGCIHLYKTNNNIMQRSKSNDSKQN